MPSRASLSGQIYMYVNVHVVHTNLLAIHHVQCSFTAWVHAALISRQPVLQYGIMTSIYGDGEKVIVIHT